MLTRLFRNLESIIETSFNVTMYNPAYPSVADLERAARRRIPKFAWDYLNGGIGDETCLRRNRQAFDAVELTPRYLRDVSHCDISTALFGKHYAMPIGIAPVGLAGMIWPGAEMALAKAAWKARIPYVLSMVGTTALEDIAEVTEGWAWFQLYPAADLDITKDILARAASAGYHELVVTVDVPIGAKRERELRNGLTLPLKLTPANVLGAVSCPWWTLSLLRHGMPRFRNLIPYAPPDMEGMGGLAAFASTLMASGVTHDLLKRIRNQWKGTLIVKGLLSAEDAMNVINIGADGVIVSNHGGRQMDAAPASIEALPEIVRAVGDRCTVMLDSGARNGTDVLRALSRGATFVFSGRSFYYGAGALGAKGGTQCIEIFRDEISRGLAQIGFTDIGEFRRYTAAHQDR